MKLLNSDQAVLSQEKIVDYLLSDNHRDGRSKAAFFKRFGFSADAWNIFAEALLAHAKEHDITAAELSPFGVKYVIEGEIRAPDGRAPLVRVIWFVDNNSDIPRLVTAYPQSIQSIKEEKND